MRGTVRSSSRQTGTVPVRSVDGRACRRPTDLRRRAARSPCVRIALVALAALSLAVPASAARYERVGISVDVPPGWTVVSKQLSVCTNPVQRLALRGHGALVQLVETLDYAYVNRFPARPRRFALKGAAQYRACCPPREAKGWFLSFRDGNRGFYAYVYLGERGTRAEALGLLDSLRIRARPASG